MKNTYKNIPFEERTLFLMGLTFVGGYINTYAYIVRGGSFVSFQTGNIIKLSMAAAELNMTMCIKYGLPVFFCFLGACIAEIFRLVIKKENWRFYVLLAESLYLFILGVRPHSADIFFKYSLSVFAGVHFYLFRVWEGMPHNIIASTGNIRGLAICFTNTWGNLKMEIMRFLRYIVLFFAFPIGAFIGTIFSNSMGCYAAWPICLITIIWAYLYRAKSKV